MNSASSRLTLAMSRAGFRAGRNRGCRRGFGGRGEGLEDADRVPIGLDAVTKRLQVADDALHGCGGCVGSPSESLSGKAR